MCEVDKTMAYMNSVAYYHIRPHKLTCAIAVKYCRTCYISHLFLPIKLETFGWISRKLSLQLFTIDTFCTEYRNNILHDIWSRRQKIHNTVCNAHLSLPSNRKKVLETSTLLSHCLSTSHCELSLVFSSFFHA